MKSVFATSIIFCRFQVNTSVIVKTLKKKYIKIPGVHDLHYKIHNKFLYQLLFCQPIVEVTSCFVYKVMGLTFYERINTHLIYRFELGQVVVKRIIKLQRKFLGSNLTGYCFLFIFFLIIFRGGGGGGGLILLFSSCLMFLFVFLFMILLLFLLFFIPLTCIRHLYIKTSVTIQTTVNSEIYANSVKKDMCYVKICD